MPLSKLKPRPKRSASVPEVTRWRFEAIGTIWTIEILEPLPVGKAKALLATIRRRIAGFDRSYSRFRDDSFVTRMAAAAGTYRLPADAKPLLDLYQSLYAVTQGAVTPLIGSVLVEAGYDAAYSLQPGELHHPPRWEEVLDYQYPYLNVVQPVLLDVGAAGKGYLVDIVSGLLQERGVTAFCVDAGGDMRVQATSGRGLEVGLEHPDRLGEGIGVARLTDQAICGSAGNRRAWQGFNHIINPQSLTSPGEIKAVWVVAPTALLADGLSTALFFTPAHELARQYSFEYALVRADDSLEYSRAFPATFFTEEAGTER